MGLVLFEPGIADPVAEILLDPVRNRTGQVWHILVHGLTAGTEYGWRADGPSTDSWHRFDRSKVLVDPFAQALAGGELWKGGDRPLPPPGVRPRRGVVVDDRFDWGDDQPPRVHLADSIVYELHVRGFTRHPSSGVSHPGTYSGLVEKIPYLKDLGVTTVELMPVTEFDELENDRRDPTTGGRLVNFWGYSPINFFAPKVGYTSVPEARLAVLEFKSMVRALHEAGIEVVLDMVFNHTAEGDGRGETLSFRGLGNATYYLLDPRNGAYRDYTGTGNTLNCNHPVVRTMIVESLRHWVTEMHVDGFRFDLASILGRGQDGQPLSNPPVLERIAGDPVLADVKLIAEAWDAAGLYQVGSFPSWGRWAEWNATFRDDMRRFVRGDAGLAAAVATRLAGSSDLYSDDGRAPFHSVNLITSHDGFTLADLVSYERRHNRRNGENGRDGHAGECSWNRGVEGPTSSVEISALRARDRNNLVVLLLMAQGMPMILAGDEMGRSQRGNNNAYCHDDETSWLDWSLLDSHGDLHRLFRALIRYRRRHRILRRRAFFRQGEGSSLEIGWHGPTLGRPDWSPSSRVVSMHLLGGDDDDDLLLMTNMEESEMEFQLPRPTGDKRWRRFVDTSLPPANIVREEAGMPEVGGSSPYRVGPRSVVVLVGR
jgi:glycogen operon protein